MQRDYFVIERAASNAHPLFGWDQSGSAFYKGTAVTLAEPIRLRLGEPVPSRPVMADHHSLPKPVLSTRLKDMLAGLNLFRAQLVPADVRVHDDVVRYWLLHVFNEIECVDRERSRLSVDDEDGVILGIDELVLDEAVLRAIPQPERLVFVLAESTSVHIFHRTVVDQVMSLTPPPEGLRFIPVTDWNDSVGFR
ncbi:imm11 family protein [Pyxidicoccus sp. MSG2]|uniref:imm11 family protein n=1 Tax=Pyxidicoccus sp. MSG2 TaxID=2996790 RepID=UPI00226F127B|nr:DUF1629 domain-containing protein [Pyxidicoccus sp. MSG2]MCY1016231.1 hypothetical protein [Pyxidicoccus sp. MSG2]